MIGDSRLLSALVVVHLLGGFAAARAAKGRLKPQAFSDSLVRCSHFSVY